jgi:tRNA(Arg) A34 adenosine deaminase TadA
MVDVRAVTAGGPAEAWAGLDEPWREAFRQAWEAVRTGNIGVGAVVSDPSGRIVRASRNRVSDCSAPPGEVCGSSLAHAEINSLARLTFRAPRDLVLSTTLQPCLQCSAAIRMAPIAHVRIAGADPLWDGCGDFTALAPWLARRPPVPTEGPMSDQVGVFAVVLSRLGPGLVGNLVPALEALGEGRLLSLVEDLQSGDELEALKPLPVESALARLWDRLPVRRRDDARR